MKKNRVLLSVLILAIMNNVIAVFMIHGIKHTDILLAEQQRNTAALEKTLYSLSSLDSTVAILKKKKAEITAFNGNPSRFDSLNLTGEILSLFKKNGITVGKYQIQEEKNSRELFVQGKGTISNITSLLYDISFSEKGFRISFMSIDAGRRGKPALLVMRVTYA